MIVQCPQCRARFRVADEKVTERGVKMRCTKCSTVFRITRPHDRDAAPPPPAPDAPRVVPQLPQARSLMYGGALDHPDEVSEAEAALPGRIPAGAAAADPSNTGPMLTSPVPITGPVEIATTSTLSALPTLAGVPIVEASYTPAAGTEPAFAGEDPFADLAGHALAAAPPVAARTRVSRTPGPAPSQPALAPVEAGLPSAPAFEPHPMTEGEPPAASGAAAGAAFFDPGADPFADLVDRPGSTEDSHLGPVSVDAGGAGAPAGAEAPASNFRNVPTEPGRGSDERSEKRERSNRRSGSIPSGSVSGTSEAALPSPPPARSLAHRTGMALFNAGLAVFIGMVALFAAAALRSPRPLSVSDFGFSMVWLALGFDEGFDGPPHRVDDLRAGFYPNNAGHELFYVRGVVHTQAGAPPEILHAAVEVVRESRLLARAESLVGLDADAEQIAAIASRKNEELQQHLARGHEAPRAGPGAPSPFVAVFPLTRREASDASVRVSVLEGVPSAVRGVISRAAAGQKAAADPPAPAPAVPVVPTVPPTAGTETAATAASAPAPIPPAATAPAPAAAARADAAAVPGAPSRSPVPPPSP